MIGCCCSCPTRTSSRSRCSGCLRAGAIPVLCLPGHRLAEMAHFAGRQRRSRGRGRRRSRRVRLPRDGHRTRRRPRGLRHVVVDGGTDAVRPPFTRFDDLLASIGATAKARRRHRRRLRCCWFRAAPRARPSSSPAPTTTMCTTPPRAPDLCGMTADDVYLVALPAAHNFPLACPGLLGAMTVGATTVFTTDPSPEAAFATIARHGVTVTALVPALAKLWAQACDWEADAPKTLRLLQVGGAKLGAEDARAVRTALTPGLQQVFGMAEGLLQLHPARRSRASSSTAPRVGHCSEADELRVVDEAGARRACRRRGRTAGARALHAQRLLPRRRATTSGRSPRRLLTAAATGCAASPTATSR